MAAFVSSCTACCSVRGERKLSTHVGNSHISRSDHAQVTEPRRHVLPPPRVNSSVTQGARSPSYPEQLQIWVKSNSGVWCCGWWFCVTGINSLVLVEHSPYEDLSLCLNPNYYFWFHIQSSLQALFKISD